jgi:microcompartment protein CcmL/EutN
MTIVPAMPAPSLALLEIESIARGMVVADAVLKRSPVQLLSASPVSPGKYLVLFTGGVAEVEEAAAAGRSAADAQLLDALILAQAHPALVPAIRSGAKGRPSGSVGIVETQTVASALLCADRALKAAAVRLIQVGFARGIGGKGYFVLTGPLDDVEAALEAALTGLPTHLLVGSELITRPHDELEGPLF